MDWNERTAKYRAFVWAWLGRLGIQENLSLIANVNFLQCHTVTTLPHRQCHWRKWTRPTPHLDMIFLLTSVTVVSNLHLLHSKKYLQSHSEVGHGLENILYKKRIPLVRGVVFWLWMKASLVCSMTLQTPWVLDRPDAIKKQRRNVTSAAPQNTSIRNGTLTNATWKSYMMWVVYLVRVWYVWNILFGHHNV